MRFNSILTNIKIGSAITLVLFALVFLAFLKYSQNEQMKHISSYYATIQNHLRSNRLDAHDAREYIESLSFKFENNHQVVLEHAKYKLGKKGFEVINYDGKFYLFIRTPFFRMLFQDLNTYDRSYYGHILFGVLFVIFIFMYVWIMRALAPLKTLKSEIQKFANGELDINCTSDKKDEIAELGNEFDKAVKKIGLLLNSRQLFLRTVMHELKTPIAKGRIVSELIDDQKQKDRIITVFEKLNHQINDFAKIEEIVSNNYKPTMCRCSVNAIIDKSIEMLMLDNKENITIQNHSDEMINADMELLALAVKNLIDNALKYSVDAKVSVVMDKGRVNFISCGPGLQKPLEEYFKPFHNDTKNKNHGMGLGIYIVYSILQMHDMKLEYKHQGNENIFSIVFWH
jgi:two-component system, OmpR family, sensor kinase